MSLFNWGGEKMSSALVMPEYFIDSVTTSPLWKSPRVPFIPPFIVYTTI